MPRLFVDQLTVIDCSYLHTERGLLGESWIVDVELEGELNEQAMVFDFADVKKEIKQCIDANIDHRLVVAIHAPGLQLSETDNDCELKFIDTRGQTILHRSPASALCLLDAEAVTISTVTELIAHQVRAVVPGNVHSSMVTLRVEDRPGHHYQYSHGLKKHSGDCQRIAHGHRSRIEIYENGQRNEHWERFWAERWHDIYIATSADRTGENGQHYQFRYQADQGEFFLSIDRARCYLVDTDSTVECLAQHIADELHRNTPGSHFRVRAFEGVNKGAVGEAGGLES